MGKPFYPSDVDDPDLDWLVSNFLYENPDFVPVEAGSLPILLIPFQELVEEEFEVAVFVDIEEEEEQEA